MIVTDTTWLVIVFILYLLYRMITRPFIGRKHIIRNIIAAQVEANTHFFNSDKIVLVTRLLNDINFNDENDVIPEWQKQELKNKILDKMVNND